VTVRRRASAQAAARMPCGKWRRVNRSQDTVRMQAPFPQTFDGIVNWQRFVFLGDFSSRFRHIFKIHFLPVNKFTKKSRIHL
jgi:hypothetical protein